MPMWGASYFHRLSLPSNPTCEQQRDKWEASAGERGAHELLGCEPPCQSRTSALGHLAVLLGCPAVCAAELTAIHIARELACQHEPLVLGELPRELADAAQLMAQQREPLDISARVGDIHFMLVTAAEWQCSCDGSLDRTAAAQRAAAVVNARQQALLECVGYVRAARERLVAS